MEDIITEKFALLNLIKALQGISTPEKGQKDEQMSSSPPPSDPSVAPSTSSSAPKEDGYNAMASILSRHEMIANRVKNRK